MSINGWERALIYSPGRIIGLQQQTDKIITKKYYYSTRLKAFQSLDKKVTLNKIYQWNYREIATCEIVFDIDMDAIEKEKVEKTVHVLKDILLKHNLKFELWNTGGKGFHFHFFFPDMINYSERDRRHIRESFGIIYGFGGAVDFKVFESEKRVIGLENTMHRKGLGVKHLVFEINNGVNEHLPSVISDRLIMMKYDFKENTPKLKNQNVGDYVKSDGIDKIPPCIHELKKINTTLKAGRHDSVFFMCRAFKRINISEIEKFKLLQSYADAIGYKDQKAEYVYRSLNDRSMVKCSEMRECLSWAKGSQQCKNCPFNKDYELYTTQ